MSVLFTQGSKLTSHKPTSGASWAKHWTTDRAKSQLLKHCLLAFDIYRTLWLIQ